MGGTAAGVFRHSVGGGLVGAGDVVVAADEFGGAGYLAGLGQAVEQFGGRNGFPGDAVLAQSVGQLGARDAGLALPAVGFQQDGAVGGADAAFPFHTGGVSIPARRGLPVFIQGEMFQIDAGVS